MTILAMCVTNHGLMFDADLWCSLQVNVRGEIGEMLGQGKGAAGDGGGPITRVLVSQTISSLNSARTHAVQYLA